MKTVRSYKIALATLIAGALGAFAQNGVAPDVWPTSNASYNPYPAPNPPTPNGNGNIDDAPVESRLQFLIKEDTKEVWYKRDNNEPDMVTKAYEVKKVDPFEILPHIKGVVYGSRFYQGRVEIIIYNDGAKFMVVTAEDYKFEKRTDGGMTIEEIINMLDQPQIISTTGNKVGIYYPKYRSAAELTRLIARQGLDMTGDTFELLYAKGRITYDPDLNAMAWYMGPYAVPRVMKWLSIYDRPLPEVKIEYKVYEMDFENDGAIGLDWQAWKNGPGRDLFSASYQASKGWTSLDNLNYGMTGIPTPTDYGRTQYIRFSPKFNTRYVDFLVTRGKAHIQTTGQLTLRNREAGVITEITNSINLQDYPYVSVDQKIINSEIYLENAAFKPATQAGNQVGDYQIVAKKTADGEDIIVTTTDSYSSSRPTNPNKYSAYLTFFNTDLSAAGISTCSLQVLSPNGAQTGFGILVDGVLISETFMKCYDAKVRRWDGANWVDVTAALKVSAPTSNNFIYKNKINILNNVRGDAFYMRLYPIVCQDSTAIQIDGLQTSLIGFQSDGKPRVQTTELNTRVQVNNKGNKFVLGGLNKFKRVRNTQEIPYLGQIPGLGFLLSREVEEIQRSQLVVVLECEVRTPTYFTSLVGEDGATLTNKGTELPEVNVKDVIKLQEMPEATTGEIVKTKDATENIKEEGMGSMNHWGFNQWLIDSETTKADFTNVEL